MSEKINDIFELNEQKNEDNLFKRVPVSVFNSDIWLNELSFSKKEAYIDLYSLAFDSYEKLIDSLPLDNWIILYIYFEINLIKELGYDTNLSSFDNSINDRKDFKKVKIDEFIYEVPNFLIFKKIPHETSSGLIKKSLIFTRNILLNKFFIPNNLILPKSRIILESYFN